MCILELPEFKALQDTYGTDLHIVLAGTGSPERLSEVAGEKAPGVHLVKADDAFLAAMDLSAFPETLFIDRQGRVAEHLRQNEELAYFSERAALLLEEPINLDELGTDGEMETPPAPKGDITPDRGHHGFIARMTFRYLEWRKR